ncbi:MAG TPA: ABC transporter ATP-binding protein [Acidimicrobiales bacterium]|nr:ABC transporter ATP-binding protein [Acidimicrobiales bacterium]
MTTSPLLRGSRPSRPARPSPPAAVVVRSLTRTYGKGAGQVEALRDVSLELAAGSFTAVMGPSGSGKSTFLHCVAGLDRPTSGTVCLAGTELDLLSEVALTKLRRQQVGFVFQAFNLLPALTVEQNIGLAARRAGRRPDRAWQREVTRRTGLDEHLRHRPAELSGGQQQRVAIARALVMRPEVLLADEPTGALDIATSREVLQLLRECVVELGLTVVMVTHDAVAASYADSVLFLAAGRIVDTMLRPRPDAVADRMTRLAR